MADDLKVSIITTTRNSAKTLEKCLQSIRNQTYANVESIVVDNKSSDATPEIARRLADIVLQAGPERSAQRNAGLHASSGDCVYFIDADMDLQPDVVGACVDMIRAGYDVLMVPEESIGTGFWSQCKRFERSFYTADATVSAARFFRRELVLSLGGYDETLTGPEDWDLSMRACARGKSGFVNALVIHDEGEQSLSNLFTKKRYYGRTILAFARKHGKDAMSRLNPARPALLRSLPRLASEPKLVLGLIFMKSVELSGLLLGMLTTRKDLRNVLYKDATGSAR